MPKISASILSANFSILKEEIISLQNAGADYLHLDIMDGVFVPNITIGPKVVADIAKYAIIPLDAHLMIVEPQRYIKNFAQAGSHMITVHLEALQNPRMVLEEIRSYGLKAGISISPDTPAHLLDDLYQYIDLVLIMTVHPGFAGQKFLTPQLDKITNIYKTIQNLNQDILISVDGGINQENAKECVKRGADILVAGSYIFQNKDYEANINALKLLHLSTYS